MRDDFGIWGFLGEPRLPPELTDGGDDAAVLVLGAVQGGQSCHGLGGKLMLGIQGRRKDEPKKGKTCGIRLFSRCKKDAKLLPASQWMQDGGGSSLERQKSSSTP